MPHIWLYISSSDLDTEHRQLIEEGRDISSLEAEFEALCKLDLNNDLSLQPRAQELFDKAQSLPMHTGYPFNEPSDLESIRAARPEGPRRFENKLSSDELFNRVQGAWVGRCAGNALGKPVEGWHMERLCGLLRDSGHYPLSSYISSDLPQDILSRYSVNPDGPFINHIDHATEDDDTNYTITGLAIYKQYGADFKPEDVAEFWLANLPILRTCTAERVAYRNLASLVMPPRSASYRNPYREWIGAQIRADFWGYVSLGNPEQAAMYAWRDASISHIKNGIYGEMWVAAMLAAAPFVSGVGEMIEVGLTEIPAKCRLTADIQEILAWSKEGVSYDEAVRKLHLRWNEKDFHHWCHTNSNAQIVAIGLLWGEEDYGRSICRAVQPGFDTDCNGATVGSLYGMLHGFSSIPDEWSGPMHDTLESGVSGYRINKISDMARETMALRGT